MIYICIPAHNEQQTIGVVLWKLRQVFTEFPRDYQLLVADDASTDRTADVLEPYTRVLPLTVIRSERRQGEAASVEMLLREAVRRSEYPKRDAIVVLQGDFSEEPDDVVPLIKRLEAGADVAVGNKIGVSKDTRTRSWARRLSSFFARGQKWPEGVASPFDGYRTYRLHAVKRAMEERGGKRLIHFDGWAGRAELLRAVLPHARRIDTVNVEDRPDRLQRPRREKPFAAAFQVRAMAGNREPADLITVEELDRVATASTRERPALTAQAANGRGATRTNGSGRDRSRRTEPRGEGRRTRANGGGPEGRRRREDGERQPKGERQRKGERQPQGERQPRAERQPKAERQARAERRSGPERQKSAPAAPVEAGTAEQPEATGGIAPESTAKKKRRRRRSRRGSGSGAQAQQPGVESPEETAAGESPEAAMPSADGDEPVTGSAEGGSGERRKRRRGGRRGGRGRRRTAAAEGSTQVESDGAAAPGPEAFAPQGPPERPEEGEA